MKYLLTNHCRFFSVSDKHGEECTDNAARKARILSFARCCLISSFRSSIRKSRFAVFPKLRKCFDTFRSARRQVKFCLAWLLLTSKKVLCLNTILSFWPYDIQDVVVKYRAHCMLFGLVKLIQNSIIHVCLSIYTYHSLTYLAHTRKSYLDIFHSRHINILSLVIFHDYCWCWAIFQLTQFCLFWCWYPEGCAWLQSGWFTFFCHDWNWFPTLTFSTTIFPSAADIRQVRWEPCFWHILHYFL